MRLKVGGRVENQELTVSTREKQAKTQRIQRDKSLNDEQYQS